MCGHLSSGPGMVLREWGQEVGRWKCSFSCGIQQLGKSVLIVHHLKYWDKVSGQDTSGISPTHSVMTVIAIVAICEFINLCKLHQAWTNHSLSNSHGMLSNVFNKIIVSAFSRVLLRSYGQILCISYKMIPPLSISTFSFLKPCSYYPVCSWASWMSISAELDAMPFSLWREDNSSYLYTSLSDSERNKPILPSSQWEWKGDTWENFQGATHRI